MLLPLHLQARDGGQDLLQPPLGLLQLLSQPVVLVLDLHQLEAGLRLVALQGLQVVDDGQHEPPLINAEVQLVESPLHLGDPVLVRADEGGEDGLVLGGEGLQLPGGARHGDQQGMVGIRDLH